MRVKRWTVSDHRAIVEEAERQLAAAGIEFDHVDLACVDNDLGHDAIVYVWFRSPEHGVIARTYGIDHPSRAPIAA